MRSNDERYMSTALIQARKGLGSTHPNPAVGAVIVKAGRIIASGYHKKSGSDHAEIIALKRAGSRAKGATLYVTLEPCAHYGKTPPCTSAIISSGIKKVIAAMKDPNPIVSGKGISALKRSGITTLVGVLEDEARELNRYFIKYITKRIPYVTVKMAQTIDGKIADSKGRSRWISSIDSRKLVHKMRAENDAVMIGAGTFTKDNPLLTNRLYQGSHNSNPVRVIVDTNLQTPLTNRMWKDKSGGRVIIATGNKGSAPKRRAIEDMGAKIITVGKKDGRLHLKPLMRELGRLGITSLLVEGGGELAFSLVKDKLADEALIFMSPRILGGRDALTSFEGAGFPGITAASRLKDLNIQRIGSDILIRGKL